MSVKIVIADDHPVVRQGLKGMLSAEADLTVVGEASSGQETVDLCGRVAWDVAIIDYNMPGRCGIELLKELRRQYPDRPVLVLSIYPEESYALPVLKAGGACYLTKESAPTELVSAVRSVARGGRFITPALGERLVQKLTGCGVPHERLSDREYQILWLMASGRSMGDIAQELSLSPSTVSTYRTRVLRKMKLKNNAELIRYALQNQLVE
jgi:DNA-binding NarL/FixJ family response regulator